MSKKPRPKKHYRPRAVAVPPYLAKLDTYKDGADHRDNDRSFLLRVANLTADHDDVLVHARLVQVAWLLAARMENAKALRECLYRGLLAIDEYLEPERKEPLTTEDFEALSQCIETTRDIIENSGYIERTQAMKAVLAGKVTVGVDNKAITDEEVRL